MPERLMKEGEAAAIMGVSVHWMRRARWIGDGPEFIKIGVGSVRYRPSAIEAFIQARTRRSTSDSGPVA